MARVINTNHGNTSSSTKTLFVDRLSHAVIKETSKSLKHYIDVKRREDEFILNPNSSACSSNPLKARFMYGTTKEYPPLYGSYYSDNDVKIYLRSFQKQLKKIDALSNSPEKQLCRNELNFHMRSYQNSPRESQQFSELRLRPAVRSTSSCSLGSSFDFQKKKSKSGSKISRYQQDPLIDNAANMLASMIQTRRSIYEKYLFSEKTHPNYDSRNANPSPRKVEDQFNAQQVPSTSNDTPVITSSPIINETRKFSKRKTENAQAKAAYIMRKAKPISPGILCDYQISVKTGNCNGASTDAPISIKLYGTHGYTDPLYLVDSETHRVPFLKNQTDLFIIQTFHVGKLAGITIGHDEKTAKASWFLDSVSIEDPIRSITYNIACNAWLSIKSNDQKTLRDFAVTAMISHNQQNHKNENDTEIANKSNYSLTDDDTVISDETTSPHYDQPNDDKNTRKYRKQNCASNRSTKITKTRTSEATMTNHLSQKQATKKSHRKKNAFSNPQVPTHQVRSPILDRTPPPNSDIEDNIDDHIRSRSSTSPLTLDQSFNQSNFDHNKPQRTVQTTNDISLHHSIDPNRSSALVDAHNSPKPVAPLSFFDTSEQTNEDNDFTFFDK